MPAVLTRTVPRVNRSHPLARGLLSWWIVAPGGHPAYRGGSRWLDAAGTSHGTLTNGPTWQGARGRQGGRGALDFDGTDDLVTCGGLPALDGAYSFGCWFRADAIGGGTSGKVFSTSQIQLGMISSGGNVLRATNNNAGTNVNSTGTFSFGVWNHAAFTRAGAVNTITFYLNGAAAGSGDGGPPAAGTSAGHLGNRSDGGRALDGLLDDCVLWARALSDAEVRALYLDSLAGHPGLLGRTRRAWVRSAAAAAYTLSAESGTFTLAGTAASLEVGRVVAAASGTFALAGTAAALEAGLVVAAGAGAFALSGTAVALEAGRAVVVDAGAFALTGQAAGLPRTWLVTAASGAFVLAGQDATLTYSGLAGQTPPRFDETVSAAFRLARETVGMHRQTRENIGLG